jgi:hypothetical protein
MLLHAGAQRFSSMSKKSLNQVGDSGARRTGFLGEREKRSGVKSNTIPG